MTQREDLTSCMLSRVRVGSKRIMVCNSGGETSDSKIVVQPSGDLVRLDAE